MNSQKMEIDKPGIHPVVSFTKENIGRDEVITSYISPVGKKVTVTGDVDEAMELALEADAKSTCLDQEADRKLLKKIDMYILPLICLLYAFQFMDKTSSSYAAVMGLKTDLNMVGDQYSWCGTSFYLGYLVFEFPASVILQRFPVAKTAATFIIIWGIILCLHAVPQYPGFIALRILLGVFESSISPAMVIITGQWYRKEEQFMRTALWFSSNGLGIIIGGAIAYGCALNDAHYSIEAWKVLFIITGFMTIIVGIIFMIHIPDNPTKAWFLSEKEKLSVINRIRNNKQGFGNKHFKKYQFIEAIFDINTWLYFLFGVASNIPNGSLTNFGSILLSEDFGYTPKDSLLMNMPTGAVELIGSILFVASNKFIPHRMAISLFAMVVSFFSSCMLAFSQEKDTRLCGYYLMYVYPVTTICALSCFQSNTAGHTKKITTTAIFFIGYCVGNLVGPQTFIDSQAPTYSGGKVAIVVCDAVTLIIIAAIYYNYWHLNKKRDQKALLLDVSKFNAIENSEFADLTDKENPSFRYCL